MFRRVRRIVIRSNIRDIRVKGKCSMRFRAAIIEWRRLLVSVKVSNGKRAPGESGVRYLSIANAGVTPDDADITTRRDIYTPGRDSRYFM